MQRFLAGVPWAAAFIILGAAVGRGQAPEADSPVVPVYQEPHHRQVFQHGPMRILDLQIPPGDRSWFHSHESPVLYVTLGTSQTRTQNLGEDWGGGGRGGGGRAGEGRGGRRAAPAGPSAALVSQVVRATSTTSYAEQAITHRLENIGTGLFRAMVVINETAGDDATSSQDAGFSSEAELANPWFRAYRVALEPGATSAPHVHRAPVAVIQATAGTGLGAGAMKWEFNVPGQWAFFDAGDRHEFRNVGDGRIDLIEVEIRGQ
jgi:quercetin dioxygenase-like cupin family protein